MYLNYIDSEKALDSINREAMGQLWIAPDTHTVYNNILWRSYRNGRRWRTTITKINDQNATSSFFLKDTQIAKISFRFLVLQGVAFSVPQIINDTKTNPTFSQGLLVFIILSIPNGYTRHVILCIGHACRQMKWIMCHFTVPEHA